MNIKMRFGEGSSPALHGNTLIVHWDHEDQSFIVALDKRTGKQLWRKERDEVTSWSTPLIIEHGGTTQVIVSATGRVRSYNLKTGKVLWECGGMTRNVIPMPVVGNGMVYVTSGFRGSALLAIRLSAAKGDITDTSAVVWRHGADTPYVPSPLLYGDALYFLKVNSEVLSCINAATGEALYSRQRLDGVQGVYASPVAASGRIYIAGRNGVTAVIRHGPRYELLSSNKLDDGFSASPAIVGREIFLRGRKSLYCIARE
jgi:outer membrane protein assembly factor BamB